MFVALLVATLSGCSISNSSGSLSDSSGSISDSISSPFKSSSNSSDDDDDAPVEPEAPVDTAAYEKDVSQLALTYAKSGGEIGAFRASISQLAKERGVTNWEADTATAVAIGRGVGQAGMQDAEFTGFSKQLFGSDLDKLNELRKGYQETAPPPAAS
jgi:hypothetical protein